MKISHHQFTLRLKRSTRIGFTGIGVFLFLLGLALLMSIDFFALATAERWSIAILELAVIAMGIIYLRIGKVCQVKIDGEEIRVVSRFGRAKIFSIRDVASRR